MSGPGFPPVRRHTLYFLAHARAAAPVYLDIRVDMEPALGLIGALRAQGRRVGIHSVLIAAIARAMARMPQVNVGVTGSMRARQFSHQTVFAKFTLDKEIAGQRIVCSATIPGAERMALSEIQSYIDFYKSADAASAPCFRPLRLLHRLPPAVGYWLYRRMVARPGMHAAIHGSFALTSLARSGVSGFYPLGGGTLTFGIGTVAETPVAVDGAVVIRRVLRLCLAFDHRAIDGALAGEFLDCVRQDLESLQARP